MSEDSKFDFHVHSSYSKDSFLEPEKIIKLAIKKGLSGVAVCDHGTIKGALKTLKIVKEKKLELNIIIGSEIKTNYGDVIGLFLQKEIKETGFLQVRDAIKQQNGIIVLPHPYKRSINPKEIVRYVDVVETLNGRLPKELNQKAQILAKYFGKNPIAGSDAHIGFEIGRVQTILKNYDGNIRETILKGRIEVRGSELPKHLRLISTGLGKYKKEGILGLGKGVWSKLNYWGAK